MSKRGDDPYKDGYRDREVGRYNPPPANVPPVGTRRDGERREEYDRGRRDAKKDGK